MSIGKPSHVHGREDIMMYDIGIELVLSMKYLGIYIYLYIYDRLSRFVHCEKSYPQVAGKLAVQSRINHFVVVI